ncbi:MAG: MFS transporter [Pseudomonadota bacterium]
MKKIVIAGMIGNGLEWYDFALYGYFAHIIGKLFIPSQDHYAQMLGTYGIFAAGFLMRPLGAVIFGYLGDKYGRKFSLTLSILLMAIPTACIAILPTYEKIGIFAPILLTVIRLLQGISLAGQFSGSIAFIVEHSPSGKRGLAGSTTVVSLCLGMLLGSLTATIFSALLSQEDLESWGWRIPFALGILIAFVGFYIRHNTEESPHYEKAKAEGRISDTPIKDAFGNNLSALLRGVGIYLSVTVPFYTLTVFLNGFIIKDLHLAEKQAYLISTLSMVMMIIILPFASYLTDLYGRKFILKIVLYFYFFASIPIFYLLNQGDFTSIAIAVFAFTLILSSYIGAIPALLVELFPTGIRYTGMALSYNVAGVLGGTTPFIETWLVKNSGNNLSVAFFVMLCAVISFIAFIGYHDSYKEELK